MHTCTTNLTTDLAICLQACAANLSTSPGKIANAM